MTTTTPTGIPVTDCDRCHHEHPVTRSHCAACGTASAFINPLTGTCLRCAEVAA